MSQDSIENIAYGCLRKGRHFAKCCERANFSMPPSLAKSYRYLLHRLSNGEILGNLDVDTLECVGRALRTAMNEHRSGYGDRAFECYTEEDVLFDQELERMRVAAVSFRELLNEIGVLKDRSTAHQWKLSLTA